MDKTPVSTREIERRAEQSQTALASKWDGYSTFTVDEFREIFRLSRAASYAAVANGSIGSVRIGRRVIIPRGVIERLLAA
jgi:uncharacterized heparinase superfamily protein